MPPAGRPQRAGRADVRGPAPLRPPACIGNNRSVPLRDSHRRNRHAVPTLFKFVAFLAIVGGLVFGGMVALVTFVKPEPREMIEIVPPSKLAPR